MPDTHCKLSPSASARWMACPVAPSLEEQMPAQDTAYTREGVIAHGVAESLLRWCLAGQFDVAPDLDTIYDEAFDIDSKLNVHLGEWHGECDKEGIDMMEVIRTVWYGYAAPVYDTYLIYKEKDKDTRLQVEVKLDLSDFIPEGFGTSDAVLVSGDLLSVYDLKYGKGVEVDAHENSQMMIYALGAYYSIAELWNVKTVRMTILQPRLNHISAYEIPADALLLWGKHSLRPTAELAFRGEGKPNPGPHCRFCRAQGRCSVLRDFAETAVSLTDAALMDAEEVAQVLERADIIKSWLKAVEDTALADLMDGKSIPGWKVVEGRSVRRVTDPDKAVAALVELGWDEDQCYKPREIRTITELEKMVGKKQFNAILGPFVEKPQGKPTIAPESDPREPFAETKNDFLS